MGAQSPWWLGPCPLFILACWVPLSGARAVCYPCEGPGPDPCMVHCCCLLDWLSVSVWCHLSSPASRCRVICHGYSAGVVHLIPGLLLFIVPVCRCHPIPYPCRPSPPISIPCYLFPVSCCPAVHPASRGSQQWHEVGCSLPYNIFKT